jgi:chromosome segregation ATPase
MRVLGLPFESAQTMLNRALSDLGAVARAARTAPAHPQRILELGEEMADIGRSVLEIAERLDQRADAALALGERLDARAAELLTLGRRMEKLGERVDKRGTEIVEAGDEIVASAASLSETGSELIGALPALERAIEMASPLEGAIDRFGRLVDRLPGGTARRTPTQIEANGPEIIATPDSPEESEQLGA